jgi:hypothetical protein
MVELTSSASNVHEVVGDNSNLYRNMVIDAMRMNQGHAGQFPIIDKEPNANVAIFFYLLKDFDEPLWNGCINHNKLSVIAYVFIIKLDHGLNDASYDRIVE